MKDSRKMTSRNRIVILAIILVILFVSLSLRLFTFQIVQGESYLQESQTKRVTTITTTAKRGDIVDRYNRTLVTSDSVFNVEFTWSFIDRTNINYIISLLVKIFEEEQSAWENLSPIVYDLFDGYSFDEAKQDEVNRLKKLLEVSEETTVTECIDLMYQKYNINQYPIAKNGNEYEFTTDDQTVLNKLKDSLKLSREATANDCVEKIEQTNKFVTFDEEMAFKIACVRYSMERLQFSINNTYTFATDLNNRTIIKIKEHSYLFSGVNIIEDTTRIYLNEDVATHLLGDVRAIFPEEYENYKENGYAMNDLVGGFGIEKAFEEELRGTDGETIITQNSQGEIIEENVIKEAESGNTVKLSIDYEFQKRVQEILKEFIDSYNQTRRTYPARGGAIVVLDTNTGEVIASVSYPSYSMEDYKNNYSELINDELNPLTNRALNGTYAPGSSFKTVVATAGLVEGEITSSSTIYCGGRYTYSSGYQPRCLQVAHSGNINVLKALQRSCNIFFYDLGRRIGIDTVLNYANLMGLGVTTGLEIPSISGQVAHPSVVAEGGTWNEGDVWQASIGQSLTMVTPISMAAQAMTIANRGTRYETHLVKEVVDYDGNVVSQTQPVVASQFEMGDDAYYGVVQGMKLAADTIPSPYSITDLPFDVAVKTGTPQTNSTGDRTNNDFVAFAPIDSPEIAISCIVEDSNSTNRLVRPIIDAYYECKELGEALLSSQNTQ